MLNVPCDVPTSSWRSWPSVDAQGNEVGDRKRMRVEPTFSGLHKSCYLMIDDDVRGELRTFLPCLADIYMNKDWFLLQRYSSKGSSLIIKDASKSQLAAICVWFLFIEVPHHVKEDASRVLTVISFGTSEALNVYNQASVEILVLRVLSLRDGEGTHVVEVQRQVCLAISFLAISGLVHRFGVGIQDQLLQLISDPVRSSKLTFSLISAITNIATVNKTMTKKLVKSELSESWLGKLMDITDHDMYILKEACLAVARLASFAHGKHDKALWDHIKVRFMPAIVDKCSNTYICCLSRAAALALSNITKCASSMDQIKDVVNGGCLERLFNLCRVGDDAVLSYCLVGIKIILRAGDVDVEGKRVTPKDNEYAMLINDFDPGWEILLEDDDYYNYESVTKAKEIVSKYSPYLLRGVGEMWSEDDYDLEEAWAGEGDDEMSEDDSDLEADWDDETSEDEA